MNDKDRITELENKISQKDKKIEELIENNELIIDSINNPYSYEKMKRDFRIKGYKEIRGRDSKPIANILLNMCGMDFCETFELSANGRCETHKCCTDCIHDFLCSNFREEKLDETK